MSCLILSISVSSLPVLSVVLFTAFILDTGVEDGEGGTGGRAEVVGLGLLSCTWVLVIELVLGMVADFSHGLLRVSPWPEDFEESSLLGSSF